LRWFDTATDYLFYPNKNAQCYHEYGQAVKENQGINMYINNTMVYGAYGNTGRMIVDELMLRGCKPLLAGRNEEKLMFLSNRLGLSYLCFNLDEAESVIPNVKVVINAAGPFACTARALAAAALHKGCHYLDISNEPVGLNNVYSLNDQAIACNRVAVPGLGFGSAASNCLLQQLLHTIKKPVAATIMLAPQISQRGDGTRRTILEGLRQGCSEVHDGSIVPKTSWQAVSSRELPFGKLSLIAVPLGDSIAAYRSSGISKITACIGVPLPFFLAGTALGLGRALLSIDFVFNCLTKKQNSNNSIVGDDVLNKSYVWVCVRDSRGQEYEAWMETGEGNAFTAESVTSATMQLLDGAVKMSGALTTAMAFGGKWLNNISDTIVHGIPNTD
jgi:short subunit dehydrogenase-like uncharacterized protein